MACFESSTLHAWNRYFWRWTNFWFDGFRLVIHQSFERKKKKEKTLQGKGRDFEFFCRISLTRLSRKPLVKFSLSFESSLQKVLEYRRRRQSIQSGSAAFASKHDELSADKNSRAIRAGLPSLEPGPSRARSFPRDMLLLTTTARERAWRLLKITSPLIGWFDGDSPFPVISPWLAPLPRCTLYIVEVQRTLCSCLFVFEIRTVGWHQPCILPSGSSIAKVWSVNSSMRCENQSKLPWRWCVTSSMPSESICNAAFFLRSPLGSSDLFFFLISKAMSIKPRTVQGFGLKGKNWGPFEGCADSDNLVTMEVFGNVSTKRLSMPHDQQMARYLRRFELQQQSQAWAKMQVSAGLWLRMYGYSILHTNAKARESSKNT